MYTIIGNGMPRKKRKMISFQLKLYDEEAERWLEIKTWAKERTNDRIDDTEINRRLLGLDPDKNGEVTEEDRLYFLGPEGILRAEMLGKLAAKAHIKQVPPKRKRG